MGYIVGIDVGGTTIKLGIFPKDGEKPVAAWEIPTKKMDEIDLFWTSIRDAIFEKFEELGLERSELLSAGISLPGPIREDGFLPKCVNLGMGACVPGKILGELLGVPVAAGNDANAAALGEVKYGAAKGYDNAVLFTLGTGLGGGIIENGRIIAGNRGVAGEVGHFVVNPDETEPCNCGNYGCLEQYSSATGMVRTAKRLLKEGKIPTKLQEEGISAKLICDAAREGDPLGLEVIDTYGKYLGLALAHIFLTTDPDICVIGGGVSRAGEELIVKPVEKYLNKYTHIANEKCRIVIATLGNDAGIYGSAAMAKALID